MSDQTKFLLNESDLPTSWYNILADMPVDLWPVLHPLTKQPITADDLEVLLPMELIEQEISTERYIQIPAEVREVYKLWRPTPLLRARRLEKKLDTPAHIYYKYEGVSPSGSHKPNTSVAQAFYNKAEGIQALTTETGAGQWGSSLSMAASFFDIDVEVYMVKVSFETKPYRKVLMKTYGAEVFPSPSYKTDVGTKILNEDPDNPGSLGIAISEAVEMVEKSKGTKKYSLGSVLNHVLTHQSVIGLEALKQMDMAGEYPDVVVGCIGGGSNFAGLAYPFAFYNLTEGKKTRLKAIEPLATPSLTKGLYAYDYSDTAQKAPILKMHTLGHQFIPAPIHAGGLRYHGMAPSLCALYDLGLIEAAAVPQLATFEAAVSFARAEGIVPAPESAHAVRGAIDEALDAKAKGEERIILFNLSGHGHFDLAAYQAYLAGTLEDFEYPTEKVNAALEHLPEIPEG